MEVHQSQPTASELPSGCAWLEGAGHCWGPDRAVQAHQWTEEKHERSLAKMENDSQATQGSGRVMGCSEL